jgi:hypothetical protein
MRLIQKSGKLLPPEDLRKLPDGSLHSVILLRDDIGNLLHLLCHEPPALAEWLNLLDSKLE